MIRLGSDGTAYFIPFLGFFRAFDYLFSFQGKKLAKAKKIYQKTKEIEVLHGFS